MKVRDLALDGGYRFIDGGRYHGGEILAVRPEFDSPHRMYRLVILMPDDTEQRIIVDGDMEIEVEDDPFINL